VDFEGLFVDLVFFGVGGLVSLDCFLISLDGS